MRTMFAVLFFACSATAEPITLRISRTYRRHYNPRRDSTNHRAGQVLRAG